jgi:hypothetical protein
MCVTTPPTRVYSCHAFFLFITKGVQRPPRQVAGRLHAPDDRQAPLRVPGVAHRRALCPSRPGGAWRVSDIHTYIIYVCMYIFIYMYNHILYMCVCIHLFICTISYSPNPFYTLYIYNARRQTLTDASQQSHPFETANACSKQLRPCTTRCCSSGPKGGRLRGPASGRSSRRGMRRRGLCGCLCICLCLCLCIHPHTSAQNNTTNKTNNSAIKRFETTMDPEKARLERIRLREEEERMERKRRRKAMGLVRILCILICMYAYTHPIPGTTTPHNMMYIHPPKLTSTITNQP